MVEWGNHEKCKLLIFLFVSILMSTAMVSVANAQFGSWSLPENYTLVVKMIDVEGYKAWLQLFNGTTLVKEAIVSSRPWDPPESRVFIYRKTMYGEADQPFFVCYLDGVMRGINANVVKLKYGWMISDNNITIFNLGDHLGVFEVYVAWGNQLVLQNPSNVTLARNSVVDLIENMKFRVNDSSDLRYHPFIWNGTAEISGQEFIETNGSWNATNFPAFWYDPKLRIYTEKLSIDHLVNAANRNISERNLTYQTYATQMNYMVYKYTGARVDGQANYSAAGWLGEKYVAIKGNVAKLSKLLLEMKERDYKLISSSNPTMWTKQLYEGYNLSIKDISVDSDKVWIQLTKDGIVVDDQILTEGALYVYRNATDSEVINATVDTIFRGTQTNLVKLINVRQYSEINGSILYSGTLTFGYIPSGITWLLNEGYKLIAKDVDVDGYRVWLRLENASSVLGDVFLSSGGNFIYTNSSGNVVINATVDAVFRGTQANVVRLRDIVQYSEISSNWWSWTEHYYFFGGEPTGISWLLPEGYNLTVKDIGINGYNVWLRLTNSSGIVGDKLVNEKYVGGSDGTFTIRNSTSAVVLTGTVDNVFRGVRTNVVDLENVKLYSESTGNLILDNASHIYATASPTGAVWELYEGYSLIAKDIDVFGDKVWLELKKSHLVVKSDIAGLYYPKTQFTYKNSTGVEIFNTTIDNIYRGESKATVNLTKTYQYSEVDGSILINNESRTLEWDITAPTYNITGYVKNGSSGAPISGATVSINTSLPSTITNAFGYYIFTGVSNGTYLITASASGYNSNSTTITVSGADITNANISLSPITPVNKAEFYVDKLHVLATSGDSLTDRSYTVGTNFIAGVFNWDDDSNQDIPPPINITMTALDARYFYGPYLLSNNTTTGYWQYPYTLKETQGRGMAFIRVIPDETINFDFDIARKIDSVVYSNGYKTANFSVTYYNLGGDRYTRCGIMTKNTSVANVTLLPSTLNTDIPTDSIVNWTSEDELTSIILLNVNKTQVVLNRPYNISVQYYIELKGAPIIYKPRFLVAIRAPISAPSYSNEGNSITLDSSYLSPYPVQFAMANTTTSISWYKSKTLDVEKELYQVSVLLDSDGDGIIDTLDPFPNEAEARGPVWNVGDYWNFTFINATLTSYVNRTVAQIATIDGQEFYIANTTHPAGFYQVYFTSHGFNLYKLDIVDPNVLDSTYIPSWDIYNLPLFVGKTWKYNYTRFDSNATINRLQLLTFNGTVVGREIISSPAGAFECYIVEVKTHNATTGNLVQHAKYWYPVGELPKYLVKLENYDITTGLIDNTWVLNDASALPPVIANETQSVPEIPANNATPFAFNNTTVVVNLNITTNITVKNVTIIVQELNASALDPGTFSVNISGTVYSYFNILSTLNESEIKSVDITFNVSKQWLDSNGLDPAKVALYRYHNGSWENYTAREIARDGNITYIATVPAFSIFGIATQVKAITWTPPPSEGGGGGGGGGGAAPGEPYENIADTEVRYIWTIAPNKQNTVEFKKSTHHILEISFAYSQVADEVSVIIEKLINSSLLANGTPPGVVFENTNIWVNVPNPSYVSNASVKFSVEKSWISANSIDSNSIALYRFKDGAWNKLSTAKLFENDTLIFYIASTPGFSSPFAIAGEKISAVPTTPTPTPTPMATPTPPTGTAEISPTPTKPAPGFDLTVAAIGAITAIYLWRRRF